MAFFAHLRVLKIPNRKALTRFMKDHFSDLSRSVKIEEKVELGEPVKNIVDTAKKDKPDLVVISTHGRTGVAHMLVGSVTERVVRSAPCPVLSVRPTPDHPTKEARLAG